MRARAPTRSRGSLVRHRAHLLRTTALRRSRSALSRRRARRLRQSDGAGRVGAIAVLPRPFRERRRRARAAHWRRAGRSKGAAALRVSLYLARLLDTNLEAAETAYVTAVGAHAETLDEVAKGAFHILSGYGHREAALTLARARLSSANDPIQRYLTDAVAGEKRDRAPADYLVAYFDRFADDFDRQLVDVLGYRAPQDLAAMVDALGSPGPRALDLGCGTGLAGPLLRSGRTRLVGVDLAPRMLDKARQRGVYDALVEAEMLDYLANAEERFDLVLAADTLVYLGDLAPFFRAAAAIMEPGGLLAFNIETTDGAPWRLLASGRFAHQLEATLALAAPDFELMARRHVQLRIEANARVAGDLVVLRRAGSPQRARADHSPRVKAISARSRRRPSAST